MYLTDPSEANPYAQSAAVDRAPGRSAAGSAPGSPPSTFNPFGKDGLTFGDLLDVINPLQHIPIVSTIYRRLTGDELGMAPRLMGGALFGGFVGFVAALANTVIEQATGKDIGDQVASLVLGDPGSATTAVAAATPGETEIEGLPWLEMAAHGAPLLVGPPRALTARNPALTTAAPTTTPIGIAAAPIESAAAPSAAIGESIADPFVATRLARQTPPRSRELAAAPPMGAAASAGGWFSEVMLTALDRYQATGKLAEPPEKRRVDLTH